MSIFKRGLKDNVQDKLMRYGGSVDTIKDLIQIAIELNNKLYQRSIKKQESKGKNTGRVT